MSHKGMTVLGHEDKKMAEKYIRLVKDMYHQWKTVVRCADHLQWKLASTKDSLSALSHLPS